MNNLRRQNPVSIFFHYLSALFSHWLALMGAGPFLIDRLITWFWKRGRQWLDQWEHRERLLLTILIVAVFVAGFMAWKDEYEARLVAENKQAMPATPPVQPTRNPDGLYQYGEIVASIGSARVDQGNSLVTFQGVRSAGKLDATREVEFRDWVLSCSGLPAAPSPEKFVGTFMGVSSGARCTILRKR